MRLAIVIPTYNEGTTLPTLIEVLINEIKKITEKFFIIIMDDASPDGTGKIAEELNKNMKILQSFTGNQSLELDPRTRKDLGLH